MESILQLDTLDEEDLGKVRHYKELGAAYDYWNKQRAKRDHGNGNIYNGSTKFVTWTLAVMNALMVAAIVGGVFMYGKVVSLDDKVNLIIEGRIKIVTVHDP